MAVVLLAAGVLLALGLMLLMLQRSVVTPLRQLTVVITNRRITGQPGKPLETGSCASREVCQLNEEFNRLLEQLDTKNDELGEINLVLISEAKKLKEAQSRLRMLDQLKSEFISTAAHELRTPVATIMGFTELLSDQSASSTLGDSQQREFLQEIYSSSERLSKLIDDILDVSRIESGQAIPLDRQPTSIRDLLGKIAKRFKLKATHQLVVDTMPGIPDTLNIDAHRIGQVMENLLSNAAKYSPKESVVRIIAEMSGQHCKTTVQDQGIGMNKEQKARIFDKFYRADASDTAIRGLGLGMSIVKQIVFEHGGTIWVDSAPGEGTRVSFTIPAGPA